MTYQQMQSGLKFADPKSPERWHCNTVSKQFCWLHQVPARTFSDPLPALTGYLQDAAPYGIRIVCGLVSDIPVISL